MKDAYDNFTHIAHRRKSSDFPFGIDCKHIYRLAELERTSEIPGMLLQRKRSGVRGNDGPA